MNEPIVDKVRGSSEAILTIVKMYNRVSYTYFDSCASFFRYEDVVKPNLIELFRNYAD